MGTTPSGLRYPEPTDPVAQGAAAIKNLATDADPRPLGQLALTNLTAGTDITRSVNLMTTSFVLPSPRWVRVSANFQFQQVSAAGASGGATLVINGVNSTRLAIGPYNLNQYYVVTGFAYVSMPAGTNTAALNVIVTPGAMRPAVGGQTFLAVEDLGKRY